MRNRMKCGAIPAGAWRCICCSTMRFEDGMMKPMRARGMTGWCAMPSTALMLVRGHALRRASRLAFDDDRRSGRDRIARHNDLANHGRMRRTIEIVDARPVEGDADRLSARQQPRVPAAAIRRRRVVHFAAIVGETD